MSVPLEVPEISETEFCAFHEAHFSQAAVADFKARFLQPSSDDADECTVNGHDADFVDEDDGLGYYDDGAKRTLTDEQIAMFRHSELEALRREQPESSRTHKYSDSAMAHIDVEGDYDSGAGLRLSDLDASTAAQPEPTRRKKRRRKGKNRESEERPDLRKRTWDVVGAGLESLDYGEESLLPARGPENTQRRRISYGDE